MPGAVAAAVAGTFATAGTVAYAAVYAGTFIAATAAVSYATSSLARSSDGSVSEQERTIEETGGTSTERVIYGRAKVSGTRYMLQKYNAKNRTIF